MILSDAAVWQGYCGTGRDEGGMKHVSGGRVNMLVGGRKGMELFRDEREGAVTCGAGRGAYRMPRQCRPPRLSDKDLQGGDGR